MADITGIPGSAPSTPLGSSVRPTAAAVGDQAGRDGGSGGGAPQRAGATEGQAAPVIRFEGRDLDPTAPRGTYLDIVV